MLEVGRILSEAFIICTDSAGWLTARIPLLAKAGAAHGAAGPRCRCQEVRAALPWRVPTAPSLRKHRRGAHCRWNWAGAKEAEGKEPFTVH